jgi:hypothetical protein
LLIKIDQPTEMSMQRCIDVEKRYAKAYGQRLPNLRARWLLSITGSLRGMRLAPPGVGQW